MNRLLTLTLVAMLLLVFLNPVKAQEDSYYSDDEEYVEEDDTLFTDNMLGFTYNFYFLQFDPEGETKADFHKYFGLNYGINLDVINTDFFGLNTTLYFMDFRWNKVKQNEEKTMPDTILHDKEGYFLGYLTYDISSRFKFSESLEADLGLGYSWLFSARHYTVNKVDGFKERVSRNIRRNPHQISAYFNVGVGYVDFKYIMEVRYRFTSLYDDPKYPEPPRLEFGIGFRF